VSDEMPLTTQCTGGPRDGVALFPPGRAVPKGVRVLLKTIGDTEKCITLKAAKRGDQGAQGLCVSQSAMEKLGGSSVEVTACGLNLFEAMKHDWKVLINVLLALLTFLGTILTAVVGYTSIGPKQPSLVLQLAPVVLFIACVVAAATFLKTLNDV
jgi:hypothetical protein